MSREKWDKIIHAIKTGESFDFHVETFLWADSRIKELDGQLLQEKKLTNKYIRHLHKAESQLCRARGTIKEMMDNCGCSEWNAVCANCLRGAEALSSPSPCRHEQENATLREAVEWMDKKLRSYDVNDHLGLRLHGRLADELRRRAGMEEEE